MELNTVFKKNFLDDILKDVANMPGTNIIQLENDSDEFAEKLKLLRSACALGFVPYAVQPKFKEGPFNLISMFRYVHWRAEKDHKLRAFSECRKPVISKFVAECKKQASKACGMLTARHPMELNWDDVEVWKAMASLNGIDSFDLAPVCGACKVTKVGKLSNADRLRLLCHTQFALIRVGSESEARVAESGFRRCEAKHEL